MIYCYGTINYNIQDTRDLEGFVNDVLEVLIEFAEKQEELITEQNETIENLSETIIELENELQSREE